MNMQVKTTRRKYHQSRNNNIIGGNSAGLNYNFHTKGLENSRVKYGIQNIIDSTKKVTKHQSFIDLPSTKIPYESNKNK